MNNDIKESLPEDDKTEVLFETDSSAETEVTEGLPEAEVTEALPEAEVTEVTEALPEAESLPEPETLPEAETVSEKKETSKKKDKPKKIFALPFLVKNKEPDKPSAEKAEAAPEPAQNKNADKIELRSYSFASVVGMILLIALYIIQTFSGKGGNYGMCAAVFGLFAAQKIMLAAKLKRRDDVITAAFYSAAFLMAFVFFLVSLFRIV